MSETLQKRPIAWFRLLFIAGLLLLPNLLVQKYELVGTVTSWAVWGTAVDLLVVFPLACYFFVLRRRPSLLALVPMMFAGLLALNWMVPEYAKEHLWVINRSVIFLEGSIVLIELLLFLWVIKQWPIIRQSIQNERFAYYHLSMSAYKGIENAFAGMTGKVKSAQKVLGFLITDLSAFYYAFAGKRENVLRYTNAPVFSYHKKSDYQGIFIMVVHALLIEIIAVHFLVLQWSHIAAWIVTILDIYALLFFIADYQAMRKSPIVLDQKGIHIQKGLRFFTYIPYQTIQRIERATVTAKECQKDKKSVAVTLPSFETQPPQWTIHLEEPVDAHLVFGRFKKVERIYLTVDDPGNFIDVLKDQVPIQVETKD
ncbi:hypothetical protein N780_06835 [Pontibacillus chungwhensis BH030062]|uniref:Beta-carotene 15,15'-monooxygenase n=1 Tax=Pontibacillus chungwhensis BH030062 TaxID=1385513 RepID=A0A0A2UQB1_9BACI|nr:hypothetical protein [Pontibacillus chungwhensis]KGP90144.1 hypothetical protein N780_06835 [Pontibacillus chungwhensis BH030062]